MYRHIAKTWRIKDNPALEGIMRERLITWRKQPTVVRLEKPSKLHRARALGYKAKQGFVMTRIKVRRGGMRKLRPTSGRRPKHLGVVKYTTAQSIQQIAEQRVAKRYPNMKVVNSYWVWEDGRHKWFEVILKDPDHPVIANA
ncbi:MAG TPA: 50S ribosomal protein L15e [Candidatus Bathyarchaeia archaeon]|nr:MAG: hypothetical protein A3K70_03700 [Candidatus Bathyarchaeota archaeon RBG_16_48_13]HJX22839.1 50S ribosomal protein L15e [Candidatus Bathyarchaeia archaeon]